MLPEDSGCCEFYSSRNIFSTQNNPKSQEKKLLSLSKFSKDDCRSPKLINKFHRENLFIFK